MDSKNLLWNHPKPPARQPAPGERLFSFLRMPDHTPVECELRFHGEAFGWEAQFLERGELLFSRAAFATRALAAQWAGEERKALEGAAGAGARGV
jgi:hypothetical protein